MMTTKMSAIYVHVEHGQISALTFSAKVTHRLNANNIINRLNFMVHTVDMGLTGLLRIQQRGRTEFWI